MNELYHHGIRGMKWGVRRFQNKDGSLTNAGKKRYTDDPTVVESKKNLDSAKSTYKSASKAYNVAYNNLNIDYTRSNKKKYDKAKNDKQVAKAKYDDAKFKYNTNKEAARISEKGITFEKKSKHRTKLEESYQKAGLSKEQAEAAANNRIRTERLVAASAALTITACAAYYAHSKYKDKIDGIVKSGESIQRIGFRDNGGKLHEEFYAAKGKHDTKRYYNLLGATRQQQAGQAYVYKMQANKDIKVASKENAAKVFGDLYKNDADFRRQVEGHISAHFNGSNVVKDTRNYSTKNVKKMYENFNANIMDLRGTGADKKFYDKLRSMGYGAVQDINDMKYSGYNAKNPLIFIDNSAVKVNSVNRIQENLLAKGTAELAKAHYEIKGKAFVEKTALAGAAGLSGLAVATYRSDPYKEQQKRQEQIEGKKRKKR